MKSRQEELSAEQLCEINAGYEPLFQVSPGCSVPQSRALEWFNGHRPLPGQDDQFFFTEQERLVGVQKAHELRLRHLRLNHRECIGWRIHKGELTFEQADELAAQCPW